MALAKLPLPESNESLLYAAIVARLKGDKDLSRVVRTWIVYTGDRLDDLTDPNERQMPLIAVRPTPQHANVEAIGVTTSPMSFLIDLYVDGTNFADIANLWNALRNCLYPADNSMLSLLTANQAYALVLERSGFGDGRKPDGSLCLVGQGILTVKMMVQTGL